jgi:hypothetical protein|nr:MAG TPA: hypothetical protein [Caudoviricetes sp.]
MNIEEILKDDIYDLWNLYETLRNNVEMQIETIYNNSDTKDNFTTHSYNIASSNVDEIISRLKDAAFIKIGMLLDMGFKPDRDSVGKEYVIYEIYSNNRIHINRTYMKSNQNKAQENINTMETPLLSDDDIIRKSLTKEALFYIEFIKNIKHLDRHLRELECIKENIQYYEPKPPHLNLTNTANDALNDTKNKLYDALWLLMLRKCDINAYGYGGESIRRIYQDHKKGISEYIKKLISDDIVKRYTDVFDTDEKL